MNFVDAIIFGIIQGLTEFLPISSSAHLRIAGTFLSSGDPGAAFTAVVQIGTEAAVLLYFRQDIWRIVRAWLSQPWSSTNMRSQDARLGWLIILGTLPIAIFGVLFKDAIEGTMRSLYITASMLVFFGLLLGAGEFYGRKALTLDQLSARDGFILGLAQALALIPGVSRSGGTITAGLFLGYTKDTIARYSFLLAIPAVFAAGFFQLISKWNTFSSSAAVPTIIATIVSFVTGYCAIIVFLKLVSTKGYRLFVYYRLFAGAFLMILLSTGIIEPQ
ncbi:undecaprenyl-diphosphate phosphatase [Sphingobium sp. D43FB]|uniref:undecaprenyl-diphosphate phosphatase n=1 Tax=Sphingobium sp. D43FB TaxID=2017595 RepID=UPI000BB57353|nr:undecaprenyl-diphosphate phosphatase [Sphingobium sp. D43FB]PBN41609.1 undecaprenyl-diphosphatase [Sphingobium sp. D43FB]|tara:strand:- start:4067 stop:4891 length:825 start_codon:yes stop_codon:yes gene_type:complete